jgi:hypothetical protein
MEYTTLILGAGAAGMMCAAFAGPGSLIIDHAKNPGEKIRISGGGRCNFTNLHTGFDNFLSDNQHFHKSALTRYSQHDFIDLITRHKIDWHEKTLGQLFCDGSAKQIVAMLRAEMAAANATLMLETALISLTKSDSGYTAILDQNGNRQTITAQNVVVATGGKSIPKMGATGLAYDIAIQFGHHLITPRPGLVPLTFPEGRFAHLAGTSTPARVSFGAASFVESMLFTHRGLSGPAILQISSYWKPGKLISINFFPTSDPFETLRALRPTQGRRNLSTVLATMLPARLADHFSAALALTGNLADQSDTALTALCDHLRDYQLTPSGSEGYRTAEVTCGGIDTDGLSSKTMMSKNAPGLYFIGECVDVTGWLGGYNFQWAWSSAMAAARHIANTSQTAG